MQSVKTILVSRCSKTERACERERNTSNKNLFVVFHGGGLLSTCKLSASHSSLKLQTLRNSSAISVSGGNQPNEKRSLGTSPQYKINRLESGSKATSYDGFRIADEHNQQGFQKRGNVFSVMLPPNI